MFYKIILFSVAVTACHAYQAVDAQSGRLNVYYAYTRETERNIERFNSTEESIKTTTLNGTRNATTIVVHGHEGTAFNTLNPAVKNALLQAEDINVIVVDWSQYSLQSYSNAVSAVPSVGLYLAELIQGLVAANITTLDKVHIVGFNLGAHVAGYAGRTLNGAVARITGLDPSGNQWGDGSQRLNSGDAKYVEVIHTNGFGLFSNGIGTRLGHVDIYPNGGDGQPGCLLSVSCSHRRAWELFGATVTLNHLRANQCTSITEMRWNGCRGPFVEVGNNALSKLETGIYRVNTRGTYPY